MFVSRLKKLPRFNGKRPCLKGDKMFAVRGCLQMAVRSGAFAHWSSFNYLIILYIPTRPCL